MRIFVGMETSGQLRNRFAANGHDVISCDLLPAEDGARRPDSFGAGSTGGHIMGDVFETLDWLEAWGWKPELAVFHPECTFHTLSAAWAFKDPDYNRYPGVGYHQNVKPGTLVGATRREARAKAEQDVERIAALPIPRKVMENPKGTIPTRTSLGQPLQIIQPYEFGDDASKATCLWLWGLSPLVIYPKLFVAPTPRANGKQYWSNQTDTGQNRVSPGDLRWQERSRTYDGIADAFAANWAPPVRMRMAA